MDLVIREVNNTIQIRSAGQLSCDYVTYKKLIKLFLPTKQKQIKQQTGKDGITVTLLFNTNGFCFGFCYLIYVIFHKEFYNSFKLFLSFIGNY